MEYTELKRIFQKLKADAPRENLTAHIIFTEDSFDDPYPLLSRTYLVSSDNKAFWSSMFSHSIFAYCLVRLSASLRVEGRLIQRHMVKASLSRLTGYNCPVKFFLVWVLFI